MSSNATLYEYQKYPVEIAEEDEFKKGTLYLTQDTIGLLEDLNKTRPFVEFGLNSIRVLNYVGVVRAGKLTLQIFPKLCRDNNEEGQLLLVAGNLLKMLSISRKITITETDIAELGLQEVDLFEIFIRIFAKKLLQTLKFSQKREYIKKYDEIRVVKGRIDFKKYHNPVRRHIIPCNFHEFSSDHTLNQTLKYTCYLMARTVSNFSTIRDLRTIVDLLDQVTLTAVTIAEVENIQFSRLDQVFKPYIDFCKIFLSGSTLTMQASTVESFSLLLPMEKLFEEFISVVLQEDPVFFFEKNVEVKSQHSIGKMAIDDLGRELFTLIPDICIGEKVEAIIDLKYKELDREDRRLGVSQSDVYQMYAYATKKNVQRCMLLYPEILLDNESKKELRIPVESAGESERFMVLYIRSISLSYDMNHSDGWGQFKSKLKEIVGPLLMESPIQGTLGNPVE